MKGSASEETAPRVASSSAPGAPVLRQLRNAEGEPGSIDWVIIESEVKRFSIRSKKFDCLGVLAVPEVGEAPFATGTLPALSAPPTTAPTEAGIVAVAAAALSLLRCDLERLLEVALLLAFPAAAGVG